MKMSEIMQMKLANTSDLRNSFEPASAPQPSRLALSITRKRSADRSKSQMDQNPG